MRSNKRLTREERIKIVKRRRAVTYFISLIFLLIGLLITIGSVGAYETNQISNSQFLIQIIIGIFLLLTGTTGFYILDETM